MELSNRLIYAVLGLVTLMLIGMLLSSWRVILYPLILVIGISILFGYTRELAGRKWPFLVAGSVVVLYGLLFILLDLLTGGEPTGSTNYVLGMTPPMALYIISFPLLVILAGVLYGLTFKQEDVQEVIEEREAAAGDPGNGGGAQ
ncbi:MAG: hypothetical protein WA990_06270 [Rubrobacteraceae bacterium]